MADPESLRQITRSPAPLSTWFGVVLLFTLFGVIVLAVIGPLPRGSDYEQTRAKKRMENLKTSREDAEKALNTYAWIDKNKGAARIPISRAMELTTAELAKQKPAPAGPIATPQAQSPAPPTSPAPGGSPRPAAAQPSPQASAPATQGAAVSSPPPSGAVSPSPAVVQSPPVPASAVPAKTP